MAITNSASAGIGGYPDRNATATTLPTGSISGTGSQAGTTNQQQSSNQTQSSSGVSAVQNMTPEALAALQSLMNQLSDHPAISDAAATLTLQASGLRPPTVQQHPLSGNASGIPALPTYYDERGAPISSAADYQAAVQRYNQAKAQVISAGGMVTGGTAAQKQQQALKDQIVKSLTAEHAANVAASVAANTTNAETQKQIIEAYKVSVANSSKTYDTNKSIVDNANSINQKQNDAVFKTYLDNVSLASENNQINRAQNDAAFKTYLDNVSLASENNRINKEQNSAAFQAYLTNLKTSQEITAANAKIVTDTNTTNSKQNAAAFEQFQQASAQAKANNTANAATAASTQATNAAQNAAEFKVYLANVLTSTANNAANVGIAQNANLTNADITSKSLSAYLTNVTTAADDHQRAIVQNAQDRATAEANLKRTQGLQDTVLSENRAQAQAYSKEAAFNDASQLTAHYARELSEKLMPTILRAQEAAGASGSATSALLAQDAAARTAEVAATTGLTAATQYGQIANQLAAVNASVVANSPQLQQTPGVPGIQQIQQVNPLNPTLIPNFQQVTPPNQLTSTFTPGIQQAVPVNPLNPGLLPGVQQIQQVNPLPGVQQITPVNPLPGVQQIQSPGGYNPALVQNQQQIASPNPQGVVTAGDNLAAILTQLSLANSPALDALLQSLGISKGAVTNSQSASTQSVSGGQQTSGSTGARTTESKTQQGIQPVPVAGVQPIYAIPAASATLATGASPSSMSITNTTGRQPTAEEYWNSFTFDTDERNFGGAL